MRISKRFFTSLFTSTAWWFGIAVSLLLYMIVARVVDDKSTVQFEHQAEHARLAIQTRMRSYIEVLRGAAALYTARNDIGRTEFAAYVRELDLGRSFPGINNLNYAQFVPHRDREAYVARIRAEGYPEFDIRPAGERPAYHVLTYLEPMAGNEISFGLDIAASPAVADTLAVSRDSGQLTSSGRMISHGLPAGHIGMAMRVPLYRHGMPLDSVEQRREAYFGSVGAGIDLNLFMAGAVDEATLEKMRIRLFDGGIGKPPPASAPAAERLLFDSGGDVPGAAPFHTMRMTMNIGPRLWEAEFSAGRHAFVGDFDVDRKSVV